MKWSKGIGPLWVNFLAYRYNNPPEAYVLVQVVPSFELGLGLWFWDLELRASWRAAK